MWVVLVVDILNNEFSRGHVLEMRKRLAEIPDKLSGLFKNILTRDKINLKNLLLSLQWILFAKRPLTREEYYFAVFTGILDKDALTLEYITYSTSSDMMDRFVVSSSKGLAEVTKSKQPTVQFIHESVRDFLIKDHGFQELWPELGHDFENLSHDKLKQCCYDYSKLGAMLILSYGAFPKTNEDVKTLRAAVLKQAPFLQYATQHVLYHADIAASNIRQDGFLAEFELGNWIIASNLFEDFSRRRYTEKASLFYVLAGKGCAALIQTRLRHDSKYYIKGEHYYYPVFAALINGHADAAQTLLKQAVSSTDGGDTSRHQDYMEFNLIFEDEYLFWDAATRGWAPVVEMFIERGADVNAIDSFKRSMLYWPVRMGHSNTVKLLIERGADVNYKHPGTFGLLPTALKYGKSAVVEILVANGADINVRDDSGETPLMHAIQKNITNLVLLLLEKGADIDCQDREGFTPLMIAIRDSKDKDIIRLLIENSADINIQSRTNQMTPLLCAIERGSDSDIIQLLIEGGADINVKDNTGKTALEKSFSMNHHEIAKILMENGADTSSVGFGGTTPEERWVATTSHNFASFNPRLPDNNDLDRNDDLAHTFEGMDCGE